MSGHLDPAFLAHVDQERARTAAAVRKLAEGFREHADTLHNGDTTCAHALCALGLFTGRKPIAVADIAAGAITRIIELERQLEALRASTEHEAGR